MYTQQRMKKKVIPSSFLEINKGMTVSGEKITMGITNIMPHQPV